MLGTGAVVLYLGRPKSSCLHIVPRQSEHIVTDMWCLQVAAETYLTVCALGPRRHIDTAMMCVAWQLAWFHMAVTARIECKDIDICFQNVNVNSARVGTATTRLWVAQSRRCLRRQESTARTFGSHPRYTSPCEICVQVLELCIVTGMVVCERVTAKVCTFAEPLLFVELLIKAL